MSDIELDSDALIPRWGRSPRVPFRSWACYFVFARRRCRPYGTPSVNPARCGWWVVGGRRLDLIREQVVTFLLSHYLFSVVDRDMVAVEFIPVFIYVFLLVIVILPLINLVGRPWVLETVPTENY